MMHWWLKRGVDGFRMDVINMISKTPGLPDTKPDQPSRRQDPVVNGPRLVEFLTEMKNEVPNAHVTMSTFCPYVQASPSYARAALALTEAAP